MKRSTDRILVTHVGSLARPQDLMEMLVARNEGKPFDSGVLAKRAREAVAEVVQKQIECGVDIVNDGELGKSNFSRYTRERLSGFVERPADPHFKPTSIFGRDMVEFPDYFNRGGRTSIGHHARVFYCAEPLKYVGHDEVKSDIENLTTALQGKQFDEAFLPAIAPGTMEHWMKNEYYPTTEAYLFAIADAMHDEYKAIVDAGFILQIDDPDLADAWQMHPEMSVADYRQYQEVRIDALNHGLRDLPADRVRFHVCWGSYHGPHKYDIPLKDIVGLILNVKAGAYSIEASNPCHDHEWRVWEETKLPDGKILIPGVIGHCSDFIEHPQAIADRLVRYAKIVGRENVVAGTDCGIGSRVGHPQIGWAKFQAMAEGARIATKELWGR
ncbi:MAG TPA: cobalamin-independent methionine synthase II family protein [Candidatus Binatia bacterium]|jgi:5-methyltetrahydropteroyltriglutamate--homocysteine methyltransferase|nr:cobalamin-independent methionine synthase II family protein [Candidatus Binatia bacterium]